MSVRSVINCVVFLLFLLFGPARAFGVVRGLAWLLLAPRLPATNSLQCRHCISSCPPRQFNSSWARRDPEILAPQTQIYYWYHLQLLCMFTLLLGNICQYFTSIHSRPLRYFTVLHFSLLPTLESLTPIILYFYP